MTEHTTDQPPFEDSGFPVHHGSTPLSATELDEIGAYFRKHTEPGGDLQGESGTMPRIWIGRLLADANLSRQMLARAEAEAARLRAEVATFRQGAHYAVDAGTTYLVEVERLEAELDKQRWYGEQLQFSIESCSGSHLEIQEYPEEVPGA